MYRITTLFLAIFILPVCLSAQTDFNWVEDISCIVYSHCTQCHNSEGVAPFSLESYDDVVAYKELILLEVLEGTMPPWPAKTPKFAFAGDHSLSDEEIDALQEWIQNDTPMGEEALMPDPPTYEVEEFITDPDLVLQLPEYTVPNLTDNDLYKCFVFPIEFDSDVYIKEVEIVPGNSKAVHHVLLYEDESNIPINLDNADPEVGYTCFGGIGSNNADLVAGWAPGGDPQVMPENMGIRIPAKTNLVVQVHYPAYAVGEVVSTKLNIKYTTEVQRSVSVNPVLNHFVSMLDGPLIIPANTVKEFNQRWTVPSKFTIIGVAPHSHLICVDMKSWAETPDGEIIDMIDIPNWDFDWQKFYGYKKPIIVEPGTKIYGRATYDNTVNNHHNPNFPPQLVTLGEDTDEEMMVFFYTFTPYQEGDEFLVFEESGHYGHHEDCGFELTNTIEQEIMKVLLHPNPASDYLMLDSNRAIDGVTVYSMLGEKVLQMNGQDIKGIRTNQFSAGTYSVMMKSGGTTLTQLVVIE